MLNFGAFRLCIFSASCLLVLILLSGCTTQEFSDWAPDCNFGDVQFDASYETGSLDACARVGSAHFLLRFDPENTPINNSPWYSFKVSADASTEVILEFQYSTHGHRYWPKLSRDGVNWTRASSGAVTQSDGAGNTLLRLRVDEGPIWVSGQEIFNNAAYESWIKDLGAHPDLELSVLGASLQGREMYKLETSGERENYIVLTGRQHPPEVTGALSMRYFVERLLEADDLAERFRNRYGMLVVPNVNPDGVALGNWRHNAAGVDLNRDWGPFSQPETRLLRDEFVRFKEPASGRLVLFLDFHSTKHDVLYTQLPEAITTPAGYTQGWIDRIQTEIVNVAPGYPVRVKPGHNPDQLTSKAYMHATFGVPAITFELGDETDRVFIKRYSRISAEQMMIQLLSTL